MPKPLKSTETPAKMSIKHPGLRAIIDSRGPDALQRRGATKHKDCDEAEFWLCLVFQSNSQMQEFLEQLPDVPVLHNAYIDGESFAEHIGLPVTPINRPPVPSRATALSKSLSLKPGASRAKSKH